MSEFVIWPVKFQVFGVVSSKTSEAISFLGRNEQQKQKDGEEPRSLENHSVLMHTAAKLYFYSKNWQFEFWRQYFLIILS